MFRTVGIAAFLMITAAAALGCGSGLSVEDATIRCDQEKAAKAQFVTSAAYAQCIACYQECGDDCLIAATAPSSYSCPGESSSTGTGAGGSK
jgi:hypothetical protein